MTRRIPATIRRTSIRAVDNILCGLNIMVAETVFFQMDSATRNGVVLHSALSSCQALYSYKEIKQILCFVHGDGIFF